jgi:hypothetical protein
MISETLGCFSIVEHSIFKMNVSIGFLQGLAMPREMINNGANHFGFIANKGNKLFSFATLYMAL